MPRLTEPSYLDAASFQYGRNTIGAQRSGLVSYPAKSGGSQLWETTTGGIVVTRTVSPKLDLLLWTKQLPSKSGQDPLGLNLRLAARLGHGLLYGITSVTPRARYYAFFPWAIYAYLRDEKGRAGDRGILSAILKREKALVIGSMLQHGGSPCPGGALGGSTSAKRILDSSEPVDLLSWKHLKDRMGQLGVYMGSLVNLGTWEREVHAKPEEVAEPADTEPEDYEKLSALGIRLAKAYHAAVKNTEYVQRWAARPRPVRNAVLETFGRHGCLCGLQHAAGADLPLLRDLFFAMGKTPQREDDLRRRQSLVLLLEVARQFAPHGIPLHVETFGWAVYFGSVPVDGEKHKIVRCVWSDGLQDIATRWRMFYFHRYLTIALESLLLSLIVWIKTSLSGTSVEGALAALRPEDAQRRIAKRLGLRLTRPFLSLSPEDLFKITGVNVDPTTDRGCPDFDRVVDLHHSLSERRLTDLLLSEEPLEADERLAVATILAYVVLARYRRWLDTPMDHWLAQHVSDPYEDIYLGTVLRYLGRRSPLGWWRVPSVHLLEQLLSRFVVSQHEAMVHARGIIRTTALFHRDAGRLIWTRFEFDEAGGRNARLHSAIQILVDLGLLEHDEVGIPRLTSDGRVWLRRFLGKGVPS